MNALASKIRYVPSIVNNLLLKNGGLISRSAAFKSDLKIKWIRPPKIASTLPEKSGDGGLELKATFQDYVNGYENSKELQDADEIVKRMFTLEFMPESLMRNKKRYEMLGMVQRHKADRGSMESIITDMTCEILHLQEHMKNHRKDVKTRVFLKELIDKRKKYLSKLRCWDYKRFEWLLEKLNLVYKPNPDAPRKVMRKESMRKLTQMHCESLRDEKMAAYEKELKAQQASFFSEKVEKLEFIRREEIACGREPTVTEEEIEAAQRVAASYDSKNEPKQRP